MIGSMGSSIGKEVGDMGNRIGRIAGRKGNGKTTSAAGVAVLIILITLFIVIYVLMLSPEDRDALLFDNETDDAGGITDGGGVTSGALVGRVILSQNPGLMIPEKSGGIIHKMDPLDLYIKSEPDILELSNLLTISKSLFSEKTESLSFKVDDIDDLKTANLYFNVQGGDGNLRVFLNGNKIFDSEVGSIGNVILPAHLLSEDNNLILKVSSGANIFGKNSYTLVDVKVKLKYELINTREVRRVILSAGETGDGKLNYFLYCKEASKGARMRVFVNDNVISDAVVSCVSGSREIEISKNELREGKENEFLFTIDEGDFLINDLKLEVESETPGYVEYKFSITEKEYKQVFGERVDVVLRMELSGDEQRKAVISVNGNEFDLNTDKITYEQDITRFAKEGNNYVRIVPKGEFVIDSLEIKFED